ncbi:MAG TPA: ABC transporter ATP-binding protein [Planctomycetota bacterium]|nr:ABC transporter ATP-binding protein [Planctomycetota bacterium]
MEAIRAENLVKTFKLRKHEYVHALDGLTLAVPEGGIFGLVGPDGAGKTTTIRLLTSIMDPTAGNAWVAGLHTVRDAEAIKESIGYMSQRFGLYPDLTVMENINFYADIYTVPAAARPGTIKRLLAFSNLEPFVDRLAGNLSGGMKQKLGLACALVHTPKILFLDEPTSGVDPVSRRDLWRIIYQLLGEGVTIFIATSYLDEAERCGRVGLIHKGKLLMSGTPDELKNLMQGAIIQFVTSNSRAAMGALRHRVKADSIGLFGDRIHIVTPTPDSTAAEAKAILSGAGVRITDERRVEPTLEDVFVSVLSRAEQDGQARASAQAAEPPPDEERRDERG